MGLYLLIASPVDDAPQWIAMAIGVMGLAYIIMRPKFARRKDPLQNAGSRISLSQQRSVERDMSSLVVELSEMARQITAQLDTRSAKLEALLKEADQRIAELRDLADHATVAPGDSPNRPVAPPPAPAPRVDPRHQAVYELADQGINAHGIAHRLGRPAGEIELILALRPADR